MRAVEALRIKKERLVQTKKLNKYVPVLAGKFFKTAFIAGQKPELLEGMCLDLGVPGNTFWQYLEWATSPVESPGCYHNSIEAFLWCCQYLERKNQNLFL
ncbi:hypothetical protein JVT61DRAFT_10389 [Boletus reticuloceps]|uniref:Uncharacterized protein n=1 Tax=Boletus reticuloceps TaxID=495285 RepID=A0A8I2YWD0_9AGAM|nr:hypothetical protein JVT61DRAFT_10389 [Boletus reticuloceps]